MKKTNILIVEDDYFLQELYRDILTQAGYIVETASNGQEGLEKIKKDIWDLVLLDIMLPKMDGFEVMKAIKEDHSLHLKSPIIFLTNLDSTEERKEALKLGTAYIIKSQLTPEDVLAKVKEYLK